ncbi:hypothetical protein [Patiriisocius hiemis]|uniref:Uncharacterized protein n=1 Tax=Patiriisocius hiemis TaxID=3075604 RepID=A0ABU2YG10_9FLAO|nr:hypothetical protein [Constantimarinum sp. W242]MDT0556725.1 hypothetical protein [Constantimarinum sp. W242]
MKPKIIGTIINWPLVKIRATIEMKNRSKFFLLSLVINKIPLVTPIKKKAYDNDSEVTLFAISKGGNRGNIKTKNKRILGRSLNLNSLENVLSVV